MNKIQISLVKQCMDSPEALSDWENEFIDSLASRDDGYELSEKQNHRLNEISQKVI